jgi:hypothetical protein
MESAIKETYCLDQWWNNARVPLKSMSTRGPCLRERRDQAQPASCMFLYSLVLYNMLDLVQRKSDMRNCNDNCELPVFA